MNESSPLIVYPEKTGNVRPTYSSRAPRFYNCVLQRLFGRGTRSERRNQDNDADLLSVFLFRRRSCVLVVSAILIISTAFITFVATSTKHHHHRGQEVETTLRGGDDHANNHLRHEWEHIVTSNRWSDANLVSAPGSNQYKAIEWLSTRDEIRTVDLDEKKYRYALTVFFNSVQQRRESILIDGDHPEEVGELWLVGSENSTHVCEWNRRVDGVRWTMRERVTVGVICDENMRVTQLILPYLSMQESILSLHGSIPDEIGLLDHLTKIDLSRNNLQGDIIPAGLRSLTELRELRLPRNALQGTLPDWLNEMKALEVLDLSYNSQLTGGFPVGMSNITKLTVLDLSNTKLEGDLSYLWNMRELRGLFLGSVSRLSGRLTNHLLRGWPKLEVLDLSNANLMGHIPTHLFHKEELVAVDLSNNSLKGYLPEITYKKHTGRNRLEFVSLHNNHIMGELPLGLVQWNELQLLDLHGNKLQGEIPGDVGSLSELRHLVLHDNSFIGDLPETIRYLHNLQTLTLNGNRIRGASYEICEKDNHNDDPSKPVLPYLQDFVADCSSSPVHAATTGGYPTTCTCCTLCCHEDNENECSTEQDAIWTPQSVWDSPYVVENFLNDDLDYLVGYWMSETSSGKGGDGKRQQPPNPFVLDDNGGSTDESGSDNGVDDVEDDNNSVSSGDNNGAATDVAPDAGDDGDAGADEDDDDESSPAPSDDTLAGDSNAPDATSVVEKDDDAGTDEEDDDDTTVGNNDVGYTYTDDDDADADEDDAAMDDPWDDNVAGDGASVESSAPTDVAVVADDDDDVDDDEGGVDNGMGYVYTDEDDAADAADEDDDATNDDAWDDAVAAAVDAAMAEGRDDADDAGDDPGGVDNGMGYVYTDDDNDADADEDDDRADDGRALTD